MPQFGLYVTDKRGNLVYVQSWLIARSSNRCAAVGQSPAAMRAPKAHTQSDSGNGG